MEGQGWVPKNYKQHTPAWNACEGHQSNARDKLRHWTHANPQRHLLPKPRGPFHLLPHPHVSYQVHCLSVLTLLPGSLHAIWLEGLQLASKHSMCFTSVKRFQLPELAWLETLEMSFTLMPLVTRNAQRVTMNTYQVPGRVWALQIYCSILSYNNLLRWYYYRTLILYP